MVLKPISFLGDSLVRLKSFPDEIRKQAGQQLYRVQKGLDPSDWKPMVGLGSGVREIRLRDEFGAFRIMYLVSRPEAIYVLHCFQKKTQKTAKYDLDLAASRLKSI